MNNLIGSSKSFDIREVSVRKIVLRDCSAYPDSGPYWIKSSLSYANGQCVEVADLPSGAIGMRDSKDVDGPILQFASVEWRAFLAGVQTESSINSDKTLMGRASRRWSGTGRRW